MRIVAYGSEDRLLTGNPQVTFFKIVFRRYTRFAKDTKEITSSSGGTYPIPTSGGDLLKNLFLQIRPANDAAISRGNILTYINTIKFELRSLTYDTLYNDFNAILMELETPEAKVNGLRNMLNQNYINSSTSDNYIYYPLKFWFCKNPGLALPLVCLTNSNPTIKLNTAVTTPTYQLYGEFIYLAEDERRRFAQSSHEYLIEEHQRFTAPLGAGIKKVTINSFERPIKELYWVVSNGNTETHCNFYPFNAGATNFSGSEYIVAAGDDDLKLTIKAAGNTFVDKMDMNYFKTVEPFNYHTRIPSSTIKSATVSINNITTTQFAEALPIYQFSKTSKVLSVKATVFDITVGGSDVSLYLGTVLTSGLLDIAGASPAATILSSATQDFNGLGAKTFALHTDEKAIVAANGYLGLKPSSSLAAGDVIIYIEYEEFPTLIAGNNQHLANLYSYSFALRPEESQPSGTLNFSRIDNMIFETESTQFHPDSSTDGVHLKVFAISYNVLRISPAGIS